ncbi:hypothetical protein [Nostoc sp.]
MAVKLLVLKPAKLLIVQKAAFRVAVLSLIRSQSAIGAFYRCKKAQLGAPKAITATAQEVSSYFLSPVVYW